MWAIMLGISQVKQVPTGKAPNMLQRGLGASPIQHHQSKLLQLLPCITNLETKTRHLCSIASFGPCTSQLREKVPPPKPNPNQALLNSPPANGGMLHGCWEAAT